ncbi:MAG: DUF4258 domain-containing protein [Ktedonobacterales bacterium]
MVAESWQSQGERVEKESDEAVEHDCELRPLPFTKHGRKRSARRNIAPDAVDYVVAYGRMIQRTGVTFYFLGRRDIPPDDRHASWASRLEGTIVLQAPDEDVITIYRNRRGLRAIRRKMKYRLATLGWQHVETDAEQPDIAELATA